MPSIGAARPDVLFVDVGVHVDEARQHDPAAQVDRRPLDAVEKHRAAHGASQGDKQAGCCLSRRRESSQPGTGHEHCRKEETAYTSSDDHSLMVKTSEVGSGRQGVDLSTALMASNAVPGPIFAIIRFASSVCSELGETARTLSAVDARDRHLVFRLITHRKPGWACAEQISPRESLAPAPACLLRCAIRLRWSSTAGP
jgi:hypothetical protein